ncbi:hypothetical protein [Lacipirellula parvula]|uniref:Uncharacterized protein n=1 Tax=Lacipirellula parvula TaxID=2650471 RepID=A0A5K7X6U5_9BACT|nr:hypothetical protein [Lacipirellula parvula]BBO31567.1 hypothetical protein PLANPX_1179 [Lacipirellula parvula]
MQVAKWIATAAAVLLIGSGVYQLFLVTPRPATLGVSLVVSGASILYGRSWGYYIAYLCAFSSLISPQRTWLIPVASTVRRFLWLNTGIEPELINVLLSLLLVGLLGWTHYVLQQTRQLDLPMSLAIRRSTTKVALGISIAMILIPAASFIYQLAIDPPRSGVPATPGGGFRALYVLFYSWPFVLIGLIGSSVCLVILKQLGTKAGSGSDSSEAF